MHYVDLITQMKYDVRIGWYKSKS